MKGLLLALLAAFIVHRVLVRRPPAPQMVGHSRDWLTECRNGGAA